MIDGSRSPRQAVTTVPEVCDILPSSAGGAKAGVDGVVTTDGTSGDGQPYAFGDT